MKKLLLLFLSVAALSCSKDDDNGSSTPGGSIVATINGVQKTFNSVVVNSETFPAQGTEPAYTELTVTGQIGNATTDVLTFYLDKGEVGSDAIYHFEYVQNGLVYESNLTSVVQTNNDSKQLKGNFSGTLSHWDNDLQEYTTMPVTNGSFDIQY